eukprot:COSAG05_NODE_8057_length_740_cov_13.959438_2_plen_69_part_01
MHRHPWDPYLAFGMMSIGHTKAPLQPHHDLVTSNVTAVTTLSSYLHMINLTRISAMCAPLLTEFMHARS